MILFNLLIFYLINISHSLKNILLTANNHVVIRGPITSDSIAPKLVELNNIQTDEIYVYLQSPGGSVTAGTTFIQQMMHLKDIGKKINCIGDIAISMAFVIFQYCDIRYTTFSSIVMQHQMSVGLEGEFNNIQNKINFYKEMNNKLDLDQSAKIGLKLRDFREKTQHDWWLYGESIVNNKVADEMVHVGCSQDLYKKTVSENFRTFFGSLVSLFSRCPIPRGPLHQRFMNDDNEIYDNEIIKYITNEYTMNYDIFK